jgi:hypothetical protein
MLSNPMFFPPSPLLQDHLAAPFVVDTPSLPFDSSAPTTPDEVATVAAIPPASRLEDGATSQALSVIDTRPADIRADAVVGGASSSAPATPQRRSGDLLSRIESATAGRSAARRRSRTTSAHGAAVKDADASSEMVSSKGQPSSVLAAAPVKALVTAPQEVADSQASAPEQHPPSPTRAQSDNVATNMADAAVEREAAHLAALPVLPAAASAQSSIVSRVSEFMSRVSGIQTEAAASETFVSTAGASVVTSGVSSVESAEPFMQPPSSPQKASYDEFWGFLSVCLVVIWNVFIFVYRSRFEIGRLRCIFVHSV